MNMKEWAKSEVKLACEREKKICAEDGRPEDAGYGVACYKSALRAFNSLCKDGHSGFSIGMVRAILDRLIDGNPLTPIGDTPDIWEEAIVPDYADYKRYQCRRMSSLFKKVYSNGEIKYSDVNRIKFLEINNPTVVWHDGHIEKILDDLFPITMPYTGDVEYFVYGEDFLMEPGFNDYDTKGYFYIIKKTPEGEEKIKFNRYFREALPSDNEAFPGWVEISRTTYNRRKKKAAEMKKILDVYADAVAEPEEDKKASYILGFDSCNAEE